MSKQFKVGDKVKLLGLRADQGASQFKGYFTSGMKDLVGKTATVTATDHQRTRGYVGTDKGFVWDISNLELLTASKVRTLKGDNKLIFEALVDGMSWSVDELRRRLANAGRVAHDSTITARIRDLRKPIYGGHTIERITEGRKNFYMLILPQAA